MGGVVDVSAQTVPVGSDGAIFDEQIFIIARQFTCVVQDAIAVMHEPIIIASLQEAVELFTPPRMAERQPSTVFEFPPPIKE